MAKEITLAAWMVSHWKRRGILTCAEFAEEWLSQRTPEDLGFWNARKDSGWKAAKQ